MNNQTHPDTGRASSELTALLEAMRALLSEEREALRRADAQCVARIAETKGELAEQLARIQTAQDRVDAQVRALAAEVRRTAALNHELLTQLQQHYTGLVSLVLRLSGQGETYGPSGTVQHALGPGRTQVVA